jgi:peroxiredoxin
MILTLTIVMFYCCHWAIAEASLGPPPKDIPNITFRVLPNGTDPKAEPVLVPFAQYLGKPIALIYWQINHNDSETELKALQALSTIPAYKDKVIFLSAVKIATDVEEQVAIKRARELKLSIPLLLDRTQIAPYLEAWFDLPRYGLIDGKGKLRIWNCRQLTETVGPNMTFLRAIQLAASGKNVPVMKGIAKPNNTHELVGKMLPNVGLDGIDGKPTTMSKYLRGKPIVLAFWSVTCDHCVIVLPAVTRYWQMRKGNLDMLSITRAPSEMLRKMIDDFFKKIGMSWPTAYAPENATLGYFNIVKVSTIILADKKGIIRYVWIQPDESWIASAIEAALIEFNLF